jgi:hypothetical protein
LFGRGGLKRDERVGRVEWTSEVCVVVDLLVVRVF